MSFERFLSSDVYVFEHAGGGIECCACNLNSSEKEDSWYFNVPTPREMLSHLQEHEAVGHDTGAAIPRITKAYKDLDIVIEPYKREKQ
jgi:hypothetical protein